MHNIKFTFAALLMSLSFCASGAISFYGDWESGLVKGSGNHNWMGSTGNGSISILSDGRARQGSKYAKIVVPPSCESCTERAEVFWMQNPDGSYLYETENSGTVSYTFSVKFDPSWQPMRSTSSNGWGPWGMFLQLHSADTLATTPIFALGVNGTPSNPDGMILALRGGDVDVNRGRDYPLSNGMLNKGKWIDFIVTVKYSKTNTGAISVQRRDEGQANYMTVLDLKNVATISYSSSKQTGLYNWDHPYIRHGLYRNHETFTSTLYLDGFTREVVGSTPLPAPIPNPPPAPAPTPTPTPTPTQTNLVANPNFEEGQVKWSLWENSAIVKSGAISGLYSMRVGPGAGGAGQILGVTPIVGSS